MGHDDPGAAHPAAIEPERRTRGAARLQCGCGAEHFMRRARRPDNGLQRRPTQEASTGRACTNSGAREKRSLNERSTRCTGAKLRPGTTSRRQAALRSTRTNIRLVACRSAARRLPQRCAQQPPVKAAVLLRPGWGSPSWPAGPSAEAGNRRCSPRAPCRCPPNSPRRRCRRGSPGRGRRNSSPRRRRRPNSGLAASSTSSCCPRCAGALRRRGCRASRRCSSS
mmetsp:Transcript_72601/g.201279  ORF Transcript_72601/g.201279 Transcript_72601/m.201279 type:complete len:224 (-) Transcript_72601:774-1445(-)